MTTGTVTFCISPVTDKGEGVSLSKVYQKNDADGSTLIWKQINEMLENSVPSSMPQQQGECYGVEQRRVEDKILLAPGIVVSNSEYQERFRDIEVERYKKEMSPEIFKVFVRHIGAIHGTSKLDISELTSNVEE